MLNVNTTAPDFTLPTAEHGSIRLSEAAPGNALLVFYKHSCGTSRFTFPFLQKIYEAYGDALYVAAIAQDDAAVTSKFIEDTGITMPVLLDLPPYPVSTAFGIHTVPSIFLLDSQRKILLTSFGFVKEEILNLADTLADKAGRPQIDVFDSADVPEIKPG